MINEKIEAIELKLFFTAMNDIYNIDLFDYKKAYILRRLNRIMELEGIDSITLITNKIIHNPDFALKIMNDLSINVTDMFRCPEFYNSLLQNVIPILKTYPTIKIWHAGCSTGEEVISLAILLKEANLYERTTIIATDINEESLEIAKKGIYSINKMKDWTKNYQKAGGIESFSDYYDVKYNYAIFDKKLLKNVLFKVHDLTKSDYPKKINLIICRNVFIYFNSTLQQTVLNKFSKSLINDGYLGMGIKESLYGNNLFSYIDREFKVLKKNE